MRLGKSVIKRDYGQAGGASGALTCTCGTRRMPLAVQRLCALALRDHAES